MDELNSLAVERTEEVRGLILAVITDTNILMLGEPGVAKSYLATRFIDRLKGGKFFQRLLTAFSTPEELFGPYSMAELEKDRYVRKTEGMLSDSHIGFIDEVFKANPGILNALLEVMNERIFSNGTIREDIPLLSLIGASNEIPDDDENLGAMYDRFHLKYRVDSIQEPGNFMRMMEMQEEEVPTTTISIKDIMDIRKQIEKIELSPKIIKKLTTLRHELSAHGYFVTDRTYKASARILKAEAWLKGKNVIDEDDMDILRHMFWSDPEKRRGVYLKILELVNPEKNVIMEKYEECMRITREIFAEKDEKKQMDNGLEAAHKFKRVRTDIKKLIKEMEKKGKNVEEVKQMLKEIETQQTRIFVEACNIDISSLK